MADDDQLLEMSVGARQNNAGQVGQHAAFITDENRWEITRLKPRKLFLNKTFIISTRMWTGGEEDQPQARQ